MSARAIAEREAGTRLPGQSRCFACGAENPIGLRLDFLPAGEGAVEARWQPRGDFEGFQGIIHGGIVSTVLDEAMSKAVASLPCRALTCELRVRLRNRVATGAALRVRGWVTQKRKRRILAEAVLTTDSGEECARGWGTFLERPTAQSGFPAPAAARSNS